MKLLAFDLGSNLAWASFDYPLSDVWASGVKLLGDRVQRQAQMLEELSRLQDAHRPDTVVYERPFARGQHATRSLWGAAGLIEAVFGRCAAVVDVTPSEIKVFAAGSGKASKEDMIAAAQTFGYTGTNEHEADAVCLLMYAHHHITTEK